MGSKENSLCRELHPLRTFNRECFAIEVNNKYIDLSTGNIYNAPNGRIDKTKPLNEKPIQIEEFVFEI